MANLHVKLPGLDMKNPVIPASGTFGFGYEFTKFYDINALGSMSLKGTTLEPRYGNPLPRIAEGPSGLLNAIGLQNPGVDEVIKTELVKLREVYSGKAIANIGGSCVDDYVQTAAKLTKEDCIGALELNISCPNVHAGGMAMGTDPAMAAQVTRSVKAVINKPLYVKLSPNVTDIVAIAKAVEEAGQKALDHGARRAVPLNTSGPFHTLLLKDASTRLHEVFKDVTFHEMNIPVIFNCTGKVLEDCSVQEMLEKQVMSPVYFEDSIRTMINNGVDTIIEIGPGKVLSGFVRKIDRKIKTYQVEDMASLQKCVEALNETK